MNTIEFYNLSVEMRELLAFVEESGGELTPEVEARLQSMDLQFNGCITEIALACRELDRSAEAICQEKNRLAAREKSKRHTKQVLRDLLADHMAQTGLERVRTDLVTVSLVRGEEKPFWEAKDENIPDEYRKTLVEHRLDVERVLRDKDEGIPLPEGVRWKRNDHIRIS